MIRDGGTRDDYHTEGLFNQAYIIRVSLQNGSIDKIDVGQTTLPPSRIDSDESVVDSDESLYLLDDTIFYQELQLDISLVKGTISRQEIEIYCQLASRR